MKKIKSLVLVAVLSFTLFTANVFAKDKVKVYIFEAGGCPYCEAEVDYLKKLDSYGEKFEIEMKELYVDHVEWKEGKDYDLGVKVANAFQSKGYDQASYQGTPFVVISNIYAAASYSESLETVIDEAYEAGDQDIVGCFEDGEDCTDKIKESTGSKTTNSPTTGDTKTDDTKEKDNNSLTAVIVLILIVGVGAALLVLTRGKMKQTEETEEKEETKKEETKKEEKVEVKEEVKEVKKTVAKKTTTKKTTTKKATTKKPAVKKTTTKKTTKK